MLVILIVLGVLLVAGFGIFGFVMLFGLEASQKRAEKNAPQTLDALFDGRPDVTATVNMRTMKYETFVLGAKERGYRLVDKAENQFGPHTLIFEKV